MPFLPVSIPIPLPAARSRCSARPASGPDPRSTGQPPTYCLGRERRPQSAFLTLDRLGDVTRKCRGT